MAEVKVTLTRETKAAASAKTKAKAPAKPPTKAKAAPKSKAAVKASAAAAQSEFMTINIDSGHWLDVMDNEGTWNVAQVIRLASDKEVEVKYDGWGPEYNEIVAINSGRVAPFHTFTWTVKCLAKYENWPWWPAVVTFRPPGTAAGQEYLANETRMFVDFLDNKDVDKRCRCWVTRKHIKSFDLDEVLKARPASMEASLNRVLQSEASDTFDPIVGDGTLPVKYKKKLAPSTKEMKREIGTRNWVENMNSSRVRHGIIYSYQPAGIKTELGLKFDDVDESVFGDLADDDWAIDAKPSSKRSAKPLRKGIKAEPATTTKRQRLMKEAPSLPEESESLILDGPHAPSPIPSDQEESEALSDEKPESDVARTSDEEERVSRPAKRLRVQRKREVSPTPVSTIDESAQIKENKRPMRTRTAKTHVDVSPIHPEDEDHAEEEEEGATSPAEALEAVREVSETDAGAATSPTAMTSRDEEIAIEIVLTSDEDTSKQDVVEDRGDVADGDKERGDDAHDEEEEAKDSKFVDLGDADDLGVEDNDEEPDDGQDGEEVGEEANDDDGEDEEEDQADPLDDWGATRSSGVEEFIEPGNSNPPTPPIAEELSPEGPRIPDTEEAADANAAEVPTTSIVDTAGNSTDVADPTSLASEVEDRAREPTKPKKKPTKLLAEAERAAMALLLEDESKDEAALENRQTDKTNPKSGGSKTLKIAKKAPGKAPAGKSPSTNAEIASPSGLAEEQETAVAAKQAEDLQVAVTDPGVVRKAGRRSSMRAGVIGRGEMPRGKTPVWVLPPPKYEPPTGEDSSPTSTSSQVQVVPTSPPFASHLSFHSLTDFSIQAWVATKSLLGDYDASNAAETEAQEEYS